MAVALSFVALALTARAQDAVQGAEKALAPAPVVVEIGPNHRVWEHRTVEVLASGRSITNRSSYTELATGMHYQNERGDWLESKEEIEIFQGAAVARQGQHSVIFAANINSPGAIDMLAPGDQRFRSHVLGLFYTDYASGRSVALAEIKDSIGEVLPPNQVIYQDAFDGDCVADVRYTYTKSGFEQDIILRTAPPSPAEWGLNPETTRLEVFTEFIEAPAVKVTSVVIKQEPDAIARQNMKEPDLVDQRLDFSGMSIGQGQAFPLGAEADAFSDATVPTGKSLEKIDGRLILIEKVDYPAVREHLGRLPKSASINKDRKVGLPEPGRTMLASLLPPRPTSSSGRWQEGQYAKVDSKRKGFVVDYVSLISSKTNYVLQGDTTYHVTGTVEFYGTTVIEGGVVIKFNTNTVFNFNGPIDCRTSPYHPAIFTCKDDESAGETVSGSTTNPLGRSASYSVACKDTTTTYDLHDIRIRHSLHGVTLYANVKANISNLQVGKGNYGLSWLGGVAATSRNFLFYDLATYAYFANGAGTNRAEHGTYHKVPTFLSSTSAGRLVTLTNSLIISVTNNVVYQGVNVQTNLSDTGIFQTVGGGLHYLATNSPYLDAGTTNINPALLASLKTGTTFPPLVYSNVTLSTNLTLTQQSIRDTNAPDLGYHFEPLDHVFGGVDVTANLTFAPGTAAGWFRTSSGSYHAGHGIHLGDSNVLTFDGRATTPNYWVRCNLVQEGGNGLWNGGYGPGGITGWADWSGGDITPAPRIEARFTRFAVMNGESPLRDDSGYLIFRATDCEFWSGKIVGEAISLYLTNCLMQRFHGGQIVSFQGNEVHVRNCTWWGGQFQLDRWNYPILARIRDSAFDGTAFSVTDGQEGDSSISDYDYNAFTNSASRTTPTGTHDVLVSSFGWQTNGFGRYYLPTNSTLINAGSTNASAVGLYHYTTTTNQVKEGTSTNDIGFHYIALNNSGQPVDSDGDGLADYLEDLNGNGLADGSENSHSNPVLTIVNAMDYIKGGPAKRFDTNAIAYDNDAVNFNGGQFKVRITSGAEANDLLGIRHEGTGAAQIGATTSTISYGGTNIATYTGGTGTNALVIAFNTNAVNASVQALARNLTFQSLSNAPASSNRVVAFELTDGKGGTNSPTSLTITLICPAAIDAFVVIDISQSLTASEFSQAKEAASNFVTHLNFSTDRVGLVSFAGDAYLNSPLTNNGAYVQFLILNLITNGGTRFHPALDHARSNLTQTASNTLPLLVLLSDGRSGGPGDLYTNRVLATNAALAVKDAGIRLITVAYGTNGDVNGGTNLMKWFASSPNDFYYAPTIAEINTNFNAIADGICRGYSLVVITNPANNAVLVAPSSITIGASASDSEGISKVEFYNFGTTKLGEDASSPYSIVWTSPPVGTNPITARAIDNLGISTTSAVVNVIVRSPPSISIVAPTNTTAFAAVMNLLVRAAATDVDGYITNVQFFTNNVASLNVTNPPFQFAWTNLSNNTYTVRAIAKDNHGYTNSSGTVTFNVDACPQVGLKSFLLSTNTVMGGFSVTGTVILSNAAPAGGQTVAMQCADPNVSIPASVLVAMGGTSNTFAIETFTYAAGSTPSISAVTPLKSISTNLTIQSAAYQSAQYAGQCGPMDVAFAIDTTSSMGWLLMTSKRPSLTSSIPSTSHQAETFDWR